MIFRRKTIFHAEEALPDPEEIKRRFRRRVLFFALLGFLVVLAIPVARELRSDFEARAQTRVLADRLLETRLLAAKLRRPVTLELADDSRSWRRTVHEEGEACEAPAQVGSQTQAWTTVEVAWKLQVQKPGGETITGRVLCLHPRHGLLLDGAPLADGKLLVTASRDHQESLRDAAYLFVTEHGADLHALYSARP